MCAHLAAGVPPRWSLCSIALLGSNTFSQNPLFVVRAHAAYLFRAGFWLAVCSRQSLGGATSVNGGEDVNAESNNRVGLTLGLPLSAGHALKFVVTTGVVHTIGNDYNTLSITYQRAF